jgi:type III secretory pathway component EscR
MSDRDEKRKLREARKEDADMERAQEQDRAPVRKHLQRRIEVKPRLFFLSAVSTRFINFFLHF